jgi:transposase
MAPGKRRKNYTSEDVDLAVQAVKDGMSFRDAAEQFGVPKSTIKDRASGAHGSNIGQPTVLSPEEEKMICDMAILLGQCGFPFTGDNLRYFMFKKNLPTHRWLDTFISRHKELTLQKANAIKRTRAAVSREDVNEFFNHFVK